MARTINPEGFAAKRTEILSTALRLVLEKGYERVSVQDILDALHISSGAFHHYFDSRRALLEALTEYMQSDVDQAIADLVADPSLSAEQKLQRFLDVVDQQRSSHRATVFRMLRVWYTDENAVVRQKVDAATLARRAPLITAMILQGIQAGRFNTPYPQQTGPILLYLLQGMSTTHANLLLSNDLPPGEVEQQVIQSYAAYMDAIERVLGAPSPFLRRLTPADVRGWLAMDQ